MESATAARLESAIAPTKTESAIATAGMESTVKPASMESTAKSAGMESTECIPKPWTNAAATSHSTSVKHAGASELCQLLPAAASNNSSSATETDQPSRTTCAEGPASFGR